MAALDRARAAGRHGLRGLGRLSLSHAANAAGRYAAYRDIDWHGVERLVFVCAGNICRSPYGDRKAAQKTLEDLVGKYPTSSAATSAKQRLAAFTKR